MKVRTQGPPKAREEGSVWRPVRNRPRWLAMPSGSRVLQPHPQIARGVVLGGGVRAVWEPRAARLRAPGGVPRPQRRLCQAHREPLWLHSRLSRCSHSATARAPQRVLRVSSGPEHPAERDGCQPLGAVRPAQRGSGLSAGHGGREVEPSICLRRAAAVLWVEPAAGREPGSSHPSLDEGSACP